MTRARRTAGRIAFVGAGPGDPGLLTMRAAAGAGRRVAWWCTDPDVPADILALAGPGRDPAGGRRTRRGGQVPGRRRPAAGQFVVRLVAGDVLTADPVVKELQAVSRSSVLFDVIPGLSAAAVGVLLRHRRRLGAHHRRRPVDLRLVAARRRARHAAAAGRGRAPGRHRHPARASRGWPARPRRR